MSDTAKHIVGLSGGKDSTAMALRLAEVEPRDYVYVCTPTGDELPEMIAHWRKLGELLGKPLTIVSSGYSLNGLIRRFNGLPNSQMRWCTRMLKIEPFKQFMFANAPATAYVGLRADEDEIERAGTVYGEIEGIAQRFPLREWGWKVEDVWLYLEKRGVQIPERTDCGKCYDQRLHEWRNLYLNHPDRYASAEAQEGVTGHTFRSATRDTWPAALKDLRLEFDKGRYIRGVDNPKKKTERRCRVCSL